MPGMLHERDDLIRRARAVLDRNRAGAYTCPSVRLYPHQWLWDSCFTAIGITRFDPARAAEKLRLASLLRSLRYDTRQLPASERASDDDGLRMLALAIHLSHFDFELARIPRDDRAVLVEDVAFNAFFAAANQSLRSLIG